ADPAYPGLQGRPPLARRELPPNGVINLLRLGEGEGGKQEQEVERKAHERLPRKTPRTAVCGLHPLFGRNAFTTRSCVVRYGPPMRSTQYGTAGITASRHSRIAAGLPGRLMMSDWPRTPAVCRDRIAVGTDRSDTCRISSPNPGNIFSQTASVASGVTSRL